MRPKRGSGLGPPSAVVMNVVTLTILHTLVIIIVTFIAIIISSCYYIHSFTRCYFYLVFSSYHYRISSRFLDFRLRPGFRVLSLGFSAAELLGSSGFRDLNVQGFTL